jgi:hypothetical protein
MQPPLLPVVTLTRLLRLAKLDGTGVLALSGAFALASAAMGDRLSAVIGLLIAGAGAFELHGAGLLREREARGLRWLVASQIYLMIAVLAYVVLRLFSYDPAFINYALTADTRSNLLEIGYTEGDIAGLVRQIYCLIYAVIGFVTVLYQGGMALYYWRRKAAVAAAFAED